MIKKLFVLFLTTAIAIAGFAQQTKEDIQKKQQELVKELADLNNTLDEIKKNKKQSLGQLALVQRKIKAREELMRNINKELKQLDEEIYQNNLTIYRYRKELDTLKDNYAKSLVFAYKNRSNYDYLNFIFSANTFNDAIKRVAYLKSYRQYRETQADNIIKTQELLEKKLGDLSNSKNEKKSTLTKQGQQLQEMETDRNEKDQVVRQLKSQETSLGTQIKNKEKTRKQLQASLQAIIRREIEEAKRKERERLAAIAEAERKRKLAEQQAQQKLAEQRAASAAAKTPNTEKPVETEKPADIPSPAPVVTAPVTTGVTTPARGDRSYSPFESTEEGLTQSLNFESNRSRLPWPVNAGFISIHFGGYEIPGTKLKGTSDGIDISLPVGSTVKSVADGEVASVFDLGGEQTVVIRHGKYFTTYSHLSSVNVGKNDKVKAGTLLGKAALGEDGEGLVTFMVSNEKGSFLDPEKWLKAR